MYFRKREKHTTIATILLLCLGLFCVMACLNQKPTDSNSSPVGSVGVPSSVKEIADIRGLTPDDIEAAVKTYHPSGMHDEYIMFSSGGHSGQIHVIGIPSMRLLKTIGVFTPEPWQGWGYGSEDSMSTSLG